MATTGESFGKNISAKSLLMVGAVVFACLPTVCATGKNYENERKSPVKIVGGKKKPQLPPEAVVLKLNSPLPLNISYSWKQVGGPRVELHDTDSPPPWFLPPRAGIYVFDVHAEANGAAGFPRRVRVVVSGPNKKPTAILPLEISCVSGAEIVLDARNSYDPDALGPDTGPLRFLWKIPGDLKVNRKAGPLVFIKAEVPGEYRVELVVEDADGEKSEPVLCAVVVRDKPLRPVPDVPEHLRAALPFIPDEEAKGNPPVVKCASGAEYRVGDWAVLDGTGTRGVDGRPVRISWEQLSGPVTIKDFRVTGPDGEKWSFRLPAAGIYAFRLRADSGGGTARGKVVHITAVKDVRKLAAVAGPDRTVFRGQAVELDGRGSIVPVEGAGWHWSQVSGPAAPRVIIGKDREAEAHPVFIFSELGKYHFQLVVSDDKGHSSEPDEVVITVIPENRPPECEIDAVSYCEIGDSINISARAFDPDNDPLEYRWVTVDGPSGCRRGELLGRKRSVVFTARAAGYYRLACMVSDSNGGRTPAVTGVYVPEPPRTSLPSAIITGPSIIYTGAPVVLRAELVSPEGYPCFYEWRVAGGPLKIVGPDFRNSVRLEVVKDIPGNSGAVLLRISDGLAAGDWVRWNIEIVAGKENENAALTPKGKMMEKVVQVSGLETELKISGCEVSAASPTGVVLLSNREAAEKTSHSDEKGDIPLLHERLELAPRQPIVTEEIRARLAGENPVTERNVSR